MYVHNHCHSFTNPLSPSLVYAIFSYLSLSPSLPLPPSPPFSLLLSRSPPSSPICPPLVCCFAFPFPSSSFSSLFLHPHLECSTLLVILDQVVLSQARGSCVDEVCSPLLQLRVSLQFIRCQAVELRCSQHPNVQVRVPWARNKVSESACGQEARLSFDYHRVKVDKVLHFTQCLHRTYPPLWEGP